MRTLCALLALAATTTASASACATVPPATPGARVVGDDGRAAFLDALMDEHAGDLQSAAGRYAQAARKGYGAFALVRAGDAARRAGDAAGAAGHYRRVLAVHPGSVHGLAARLRLRDTASQAGPASPAAPVQLHASLTVRAVQAADIIVDRERAGLAPLEALPLAAGRHTIVVVADGYEPQRVELDVAAGEAVDVRFDLARRAVQRAGPADAVAGVVVLGAMRILLPLLCLAL